MSGRFTLVVALAGAATALGASRAEAQEYLFYGTPSEAIATQMQLDLQSVFANAQAATQAKQDIGQRLAKGRTERGASPYLRGLP